MKQSNFLPYIDTIYSEALEQFPGYVSLVDSNPPDYLEFKIINLPEQKKNYLPKLVEITLERKANFMLIDDYRWEFDDDIKRTETEVSRYLSALKNGKLQVRGVKFMNERLDIAN